jgi:hypothetical protein
MFTLTTFFILSGFFKEGEGLSNSRSSHSTRATFNFRNTVRVLTDKFTLGFRASGFMTFPVTSGFFTDGFTFGFGSLTVGDAMRLFADSDTLRAVEHFTSFIRAFNFAFGFLTFYVADSVLGFGTTGVTFRRFTYRIADSGAVRIVTFPRALGMTLKFKY